jgi:hypothetical protein
MLTTPKRLPFTEKGNNSLKTERFDLTYLRKMSSLYIAMRLIVLAMDRLGLERASQLR